MESAIKHITSVTDVMAMAMNLRRSLWIIPHPPGSTPGGGSHG